MGCHFENSSKILETTRQIWSDRLQKLLHLKIALTAPIQASRKKVAITTLQARNRVPHRHNSDVAVFQRIQLDSPPSSTPAILKTEQDSVMNTIKARNILFRLQQPTLRGTSCPSDTNKKKGTHSLNIQAKREGDK